MELLPGQMPREKPERSFIALFRNGTGRVTREIMDTDLADVKITKDTRFVRGDARLSTGRFYTDDELKKKRKRVLETKL
jgi:hypothetical protein